MVFKRIKREEGGAVLKWFEDKDIIASMVQGDFPNEAELRISGKGFESFKSRGSRELMLKKSDKALVDSIKRMIKIRKNFG